MMLTLSPVVMRHKLAVHEAGHATARVVLGGAVQYASIYAGDPHVRPTRVLVGRDEHVAILAGIAAEFFFFPNESKVGHYGNDDWNRASGWSREELREASIRAKQLVEENCEAILRVAMELEQLGTVSGERVREITRPC